MEPDGSIQEVGRGVVHVLRFLPNTSVRVIMLHQSETDAGVCVCVCVCVFVCGHESDGNTEVRVQCKSP